MKIKNNNSFPISPDQEKTLMLLTEGVHFEEVTRAMTSEEATRAITSEQVTRAMTSDEFAKNVSSSELVRRYGNVNCVITNYTIPSSETINKPQHVSSVEDIQITHWEKFKPVLNINKPQDQIISVVSDSNVKTDQQVLVDSWMIEYLLENELIDQSNLGFEIDDLNFSDRYVVSKSMLLSFVEADVLHQWPLDRYAEAYSVDVAELDLDELESGFYFDGYIYVDDFNDSLWEQFLVNKRSVEENGNGVVVHFLCVGVLIYVCYEFLVDLQNYLN